MLSSKKTCKKHFISENNAAMVGTQTQGCNMLFRRRRICCLSERLVLLLVNVKKSATATTELIEIMFTSKTVCPSYNYLSYVSSR